jgi:dipeptidyl aminopeptidase/acylaminoacyl peptidase
VSSPLTPEDLARFRWVDHVRLSPGGDRVAYQLSWADVEARRNRGQVVVVDLEEGSPLEVEAGSARDHSPEWSPSGNHLAFLGRRGGRDQLFVTELASGHSRRLTDLPDGVLAARWAPDGSRLAVLAWTLTDPEAVVDDPRPVREEEQVRRPPVARVVRRLDDKHDGAGFVDGRHAHLFLVPASGGEPRQLTTGAWSVEGFDWAPDGRAIVVAGDAEPDADLRRTRRLYLIDVWPDRGPGESLRELCGGLMLSSPAWSPRGDLIAFVAPLDEDGGRHERVWVVPTAGGEPRCLTADLDRAAGGAPPYTDMRTGHGSRLVWSATGDRIWFLATGPGVAELCSVDLNGRVEVELPAQRRVIYDFDLCGGLVGACISDPCSPGEVVLARDGQERSLTDANPWLRDRYVALPERYLFTARDGLQIEGWLLRPSNFDPGRRYPLVMQIHGGPHGQYGWTFFHEFQVLAGMGFLVFYVNPRGSDGYGEAFKRAVVCDWGGADYEDLMTALDQLIERTGFVDESRLGVAGGSYGGFMTNWIVGHTDRFAAAVSMRSLSNLVSDYGQDDIVLWNTVEMGPPPWPDADELWRRSPLRYVREIRTPLLLLHGEQDLRCPISQAEELFAALRLLGREVELVRFPGESHDLSRSGRPDRRLERLRRLVGWFERHLGSTRAVADETVTAG